MGTFLPTRYGLKNGSSCIVRSATPQDAIAVLECAREMFATSMYTLTPDQERDFIAARLAAPNEAFLIAAPGENAGEEVGEVWGMLGLLHPKPRRKVRHTVELGMGLRSTHRGIGLGSALMDAAIAFGRSRPDLEIITLAVYQDNAAGRALYSKFGFIQYGFLPNGCKHDDHSRWDQIEMYKPLS